MTSNLICVSSAESLAKSLQETGVDGFHREDIMNLLKRNPVKESFQWTGISQEKIDRQLVKISNNFVR